MCITYLNPTGFCLITGLTQTTLLKVLNSRRSIRDKVGLTVTPSADLEESMQVSRNDAALVCGLMIVVHSAGDVRADGL